MRTFILFSVYVNILAAKEIKLDLTILDPKEKALAEAKCTVQFNKVDSKKTEIITQSSDSSGKVSFTINTNEDLYVEVNKEGYYTTRIYDLPTSQNLSQLVKLQEKINPTALYVRHHSGNLSESLKFPKTDQWYNYDLKIGDWVKPHGKGVTADLKMKLHCEEKSLAHSYLEIETLEDESGVFITHDLNEYSELKLPNLAPTENYIKGIKIPGDEWEINRGIFLRTRVETDKEGKIISANYGKVQGPITINRQGVIGFTHYFNGRTNDRNLEFDPTQNLLKRDDELTDPQFKP